MKKLKFCLGLALLSLVFACESQDQLIDESPMSPQEDIELTTIPSDSNTSGASHGMKVRTHDPFAK